MKRCSLREWIPILPIPTWPLAGQCRLGQNVVVGSMTLLLAVRGNIATRSMSGPPVALQLHRTTVWCGATVYRKLQKNLSFRRWRAACQVRIYISNCDRVQVEVLTQPTLEASLSMPCIPGHIGRG